MEKPQWQSAEQTPNTKPHALVTTPARDFRLSSPIGNHTLIAPTELFTAAVEEGHPHTHAETCTRTAQPCMWHFCRYDCNGTQRFIHLSHFFSRSVTLCFCLHANGKHLSDRIGKSCDLCLCLQILSPLLSSADSHNCLTDAAQLLKSYIL